MSNRIFAYLMDKKSGGMIGVNHSGYFLASLYREGKGPDEIVKLFLVDNPTSVSAEKIKVLATNFIGQMEQKGLFRDRLRIIQPKERFHPFTIQLDLSWSCNLKCRHCYLKDTRLILAALTEEEWQGVISQAREMDIPKIAFLGGEPLLSPYFFRLSEYAYGLDFKLYTTTNGTLVDGGIAKDLLKVGFNEIDISLDGASAETHQFLRGEGTFAQMVKGAEHLVNVGLLVKSATVLHKKNIAEILAILSLGKKLGLSEMYFNQLLPGGRGADIWDDLLISFEEWMDVKGKIREWNKKNKKPRAFAENSFDFVRQIPQSLSFKGCDYAGCKAGKRELIITPDGFAVACPLLSTERDFHTLNVRERSLKEIWHSDEWICKLRDVNESTVLGKCKTCPGLSICQGGCHVLALFKRGDLNQPDPRCPI